MKKLLSVLLALVLLFSFAACSKMESNSGTGSESQSFTKPEGYGAILAVKINPEINLYLSAEGTVLATEFVNEDAKTLADAIDTTVTDLKSALKNIITAANNKGFIPSDTKVVFALTENTASLVEADLLATSNSAVSEVAAQLNLTINASSETDTTDVSSAVVSDNKQETASDPAPNAHKHHHSAATCTKPATCSCGATSGTAKGHHWKAATCTAPKTCDRCGATEGNKGNHSYRNGVCSTCGATSTLNPQTDLSQREYVGNLKVSGEMLIGAGLQFESEVCVVIARYFNAEQSDPEQSYITFEGKKYYSEGGGQEPYYYELTDKEIIVKNSYYEETPGAATIKLVLQADGMLKVTSSSNPDFPVGTILSTNLNDVVR